MNHRRQFLAGAGGLVLGMAAGTGRLTARAGSRPPMAANQRI